MAKEKDNFDYSKLSVDELKRLAYPEDYEKKKDGLLKSIGKGYINYAKGAAKGMAQGLGDFGASVINWPISGVEHLTGKSLPHVPHPHLLNENPDSFSESLGQVMGQIGGGLLAPGGLGIKGMQMANKGYQAYRAGKNLPIAAKALVGTGLGGIEGAAGNEDNRGMGATIGAILGGGSGIVGGLLGSKLAERGKNLAKAGDIAENRASTLQAHQDQQKIIGDLRKQFLEQGSSFGSPEGMQRALNKKRAEFEGLGPHSQIPYEPTQNLLPWGTGEAAVTNAAKKMEDITADKARYLGAGTKIDNEIVREVTESVKKAKSYIQKEGYGPVEQWAADHHVQLPRTPNVKEIESQIKKYTSDPKLQEIARGQLVKQESSGKDLVKATDFISQWKDTKKMAAKARRMGFKEGGEDQSYWQDQAIKLQELAHKQYNVLKDHVPKDVFEKLEWANNAWKEEIVPFYGNKIYEQAKGGKINVKDIIHELRGLGPGDEKMRQLFLANPTLAKLALGRNHAANPKGLFNASPYEKEFINALPELQEKMQKYQQAEKNHAIAQFQQGKMAENAKSSEMAHKEILQQQGNRQHAISTRAKLDQEIQALQHQKSLLEKELEKGNITTQAYQKADAQYQQAMKDKKLAKILLGSLITGNEVRKHIF